MFVAHGAQVVIADIQTEAGERLAEELGRNAVFMHLDVTRLEQWQAVVAGIVERFGSLDILVNNAGAGGRRPIESEQPEDHRRLVELNQISVWGGIRTVVPVMKAQGSGSIVNISSIDGLVGVTHMATYVATKFAVTGMTRALALELGDSGIRVNSVHPGVTGTPAVMNASPSALDRLKRVVATQPINRIGRPEEVAYAVLFFASDESSYCTGTSLVVDGGHLAGPWREVD